MANKHLTATLVTTTRSAHALVAGEDQASSDRWALTQATQTAAREYVELLTLCPKDTVAHKKAHARYKAAQAAEIRAVAGQNLSRKGTP